MAKNQADPIIVGPARLAFPNVVTPDKNGKYTTTILLSKSDPDAMKALETARRLLLTQAKMSWGENKEKWPAALRKVSFKDYVSATGKDGFPLRDGDDVSWDGFAGNYFLRASSQYQPGMVDGSLAPLLNPEKEMKAGMICRFQVNAFAYDKEGNSGLSWGLLNIQLVRDDGTRFGGGAQKAQDVFDKIMAEDDELSSENPENYASSAENDEDW